MAYYRTCKFLLVYCAMFVSYEGKNWRAESAEDLHNGTPIEHLNLQNSLTTEYHKQQSFSNEETKVNFPDLKFTFNFSDSDKNSGTDILNSSSSSRTAITTVKSTRQRSMNDGDRKSQMSFKPTSNTTGPYMTLSTPYLEEHLAKDQITEQPYESTPTGLGKDEDSGLLNVYIGGLFELTDTPGIVTYGRSELASAQLAIRHINEKGILPGYKLNMLYNDTKVSTALSLPPGKNYCWEEV